MVMASAALALAFGAREAAATVYNINLCFDIIKI